MYPRSDCISAHQWKRRTESVSLLEHSVDSNLELKLSRTFGAYAFSLFQSWCFSYNREWIAVLKHEDDVEMQLAS